MRSVIKNEEWKVGNDIPLPMYLDKKQALECSMSLLDGYFNYKIMFNGQSILHARSFIDMFRYMWM